MSSASAANLNFSSTGLFREKQLLVLFGNPSQKNDYLQQVKLRLEKKSHLYLFESTNSSSILSEVSRFQAGALFFSIRTENELETVVRSLGQFREMLKTGMVHAIGTCNLENPKAFEILQRIGAEVYPFSLEWADLEKKIDTFCHVLKSHYPNSLQSALPLVPELKLWISRKEGAPIEALPIEFGENQLLLEVESQLFTLGEDVLLSTNDGSPSFSTKVVQVIPADENHAAVSIDTNAEFENQFVGLRKARDKTQALIFDFMKAAQGR